MTEPTRLDFVHLRMRSLATGPVLLIGIAVIAALSGVLYSGSAMRAPPMPPEVFERAKAFLPAELPSFESREYSRPSSTHWQMDARHPLEEDSGEPRNPSSEEFFDESDNDLPFEESLGREDVSSAASATDSSGVRNVRIGGPRRIMGSVDHALEWFKREQRSDGSWDGNVQTTGLVLLALLGAGETHKHGRHKKTVRAGLEWLIRQQTTDGWFTSGGDPAGQAIATLVMCEIFLLTGGRTLSFEKPARRGLACLESLGPA